MVSMPAASSRSRSAGGGKGTPYAACSRSHQPAPTPQNAAPPVRTSSVARALARIPGARRDRGETSVPSRRPGTAPASKPRATKGSGRSSHSRPTWGIWIRWSISATPSKPASCAARATATSQPARSRSGSLSQGKREICSTKPSGRSAVGCRAAPASAGSGGAGRLHRSRLAGGAGGGRPDDHDLVPALLPELVGHRPHLAQLPGQCRRRHRQVALAVAGPAELGRGVEPDRDRGQAGAAGQAQPPGPAVRVDAEGVDDGGEAAAEAGGHDQVEHREGVGRGARGRAARCRRPRAARPRTRSRPVGIVRRPRSTCPTRMLRPARPAPDQRPHCPPRTGILWIRRTRPAGPLRRRLWHGGNSFAPTMAREKGGDEGPYGGESARCP